MELVTTGEIKHITLRTSTEVYEVAIEISGPKTPKTVVFEANPDFLIGKKVGDVVTITVSDGVNANPLDILGEL